MSQGRTSIAIAGLGAIGRVLASELQTRLPNYTLAAVAARDQIGAKDFLADIGSDASVLPLDELADAADIVIECAPAEHFMELAGPAVDKGRTLFVLSSGALLHNWSLVSRAEANRARILIPTGALLGLDAVQAAAMSTIHSVTMVSTKPVAGLRGAPYLVQNQIDIEHLDEPELLFAGSARDAAVAFPSNLNVATALSLAGIGPDRTMLEVWADPAATTNQHRITVKSDAALLDFSIANTPTENPRTGRITPLSVLALLKKRASTVQVGT